jgi:hypothetical protein
MGHGAKRTLPQFSDWLIFSVNYFAWGIGQRAEGMESGLHEPFDIKIARGVITFFVNRR